ncbi:hypothetical protein AB0H77_14680 [Streptomyces sp. NPDC050844]|uniref:hypothetical protein n=1 Tax=Streptomyces sp. NPDC050844 TaxID=3155790 RepID=UPI0033D968B0
MDTQQTDRAAEWLARAQQEPGHAWHEWAETGVALLPLGRRFVAPRLAEALVHAAVGTRAPGAVSTCLEELLDGPVMQWAVPPRRAGDLCEPAAVDALVTLACTAARQAEQ